MPVRMLPILPSNYTLPWCSYWLRSSMWKGQHNRWFRSMVFLRSIRMKQLVLWLFPMMVLLSVRLMLMHGKRCDKVGQFYLRPLGLPAEGKNSFMKSDSLSTFVHDEWINGTYISNCSQEFSQSFICGLHFVAVACFHGVSITGWWAAGEICQMSQQLLLVCFPDDYQFILLRYIFTNFNRTCQNAYIIDGSVQWTILVRFVWKGWYCCCSFSWFGCWDFCWGIVAHGLNKFKDFCYGLFALLERAQETQNIWMKIWNSLSFWRSLTKTYFSNSA